MQVERLTPSDRFDARALNWRFIAPSEPPGLLLLPARDERLPLAVTPVETEHAVAEAFRVGPYPGVAIADLHRWAGIAHCAPAALLLQAARAVERGGWLYAGFANPLYPLRARGGTLGLRKALAAIERAELSAPDVYLLFPDHRTPAYIVPRSGEPELDLFLRRLFVPYADGDGTRAQVARTVLPLARRVAVAAPHRVRAAFAPAFGILGVRP
jgi:hypothetical protein